MYCYNQGNGTYIPSMKHILPSFGLGREGILLSATFWQAPQKVAKNALDYW